MGSAGERNDIPSFIGQSISTLSWAVAMDLLNVHCNVTHQLFDFCSLITSHHMRGLKYAISSYRIV